MIIFELDNVLANCEHRRHLIDKRHINCGLHNPRNTDCIYCLRKLEQNQPDWQAYWDACDKDEPIQAVINLFDDLAVNNEIEIWTSRSEFIRDKTTNWLYENAPYSGQTLKMRPLGNKEPDHILKENWLNECKESIEMAFDADPESIAMYRRRGIFVFDCKQT